MRTRKNWLRTTIAMITLIATVIETGFSSVATYAAVLDTDDSAIVSDEAQDSVITDDGSVEEDISVDAEDIGEAPDETEINISAPSEEDIAAPEEADKADEAAPAEEADEQKKPGIDITDNGISGSGYDEIVIYIDTKNLDKNDKFRVKFVGADSASYNPALNDELDKTNGGQYTFENLSGEGFSVRATSTDKVILSYNYNENGDPVISAASKSVDKKLATKILTAVDDSKISAVTGEGLEAVTVKFDTENLSDESTFALYVETEAQAVVDGQDATKGITGLDANTGAVTVEGLDKESFIAYVVSDQENKKISSAASIEDVDNGVAVIAVDNVDTKRVYEFEDSKIAVTAILQKADAIPDDAYFAVTPLSEEEAKAYLDALNASLEEGQDEVTAEDILLYDIGFYTDETMTEEIEPEEGSVSISIEFKKSQITEELGVENSEDVQVTHFVEDGKTIEPVEVDAKASTYEEKVDFTVDSFSVYGIWATTMANVKAGKTVSYADVLGEAVNYGIVANEMTLAGHMESNFAVSKMHGAAQIQSNKNNGGGAGRVYIGEYDDNSHSFIMDLNGNSGVLQIVTTKDVAGRFDPCMASRSGVFVDTNSMSKDQIQKKVSGMVTAVTDTSDALMKEINCYQYASIVKNGCVDFTSKPAGTYYISFDTADNNTANKFPGSNYEIRINSDQNVVLNIPDEKVSFGQYRLYIDGVQRVPQGNSDEEVLFEKLIFNCPNATWAETNGPVTGTFLLPRADFYNNSVAAGFLVANNIKRIGGSEWHCISRNIEVVEDDTTKLDIGVTKIFKDAAGNIVDDGLWPDEGFTFKIKKYTCNDPGDVNGSEVIRDVNKIPNLKDAKETVTIYKDTPNKTASFGYFEFKGKELYENNPDAKPSGTYQNTKYICFMYKIEEVTGTEPGIRYSATPRYIKVFVNSQKVVNGNHTKYYVWTETKVNDNVLYYNCKPDLIEFVNTYCPPDVPVDLEGIKKVNGQTDIVPDGAFTFKLYKYNKNKNGFDTTPIQTKKNKSLSIKFDTMKLKFDEAPFFSNAAGASKSSQAYYYFLIKEDQVAKPYIYDKSVFVAKVTLIKDYNNNKINSNVEYYKFDDENALNNNLSALIGTQSKAKCVEFKATDLEFNNTYEANGSTVIYGQKKIENRTFKKGDKFTFTLTPKKVGEVVDTHNAAQEITIEPKEENGYYYDFEFAPLSYTLNDIPKNATTQKYTYEVKETRVDAQNVTKDSRTYDVVVTIEENGTGTLKATPNKGTQIDRLKFTNIYDASGSEKFGAHKIYGAGLSSLAENKKFTFIFEGDGIDGEIKGVATGENDAIFPGGKPYVTVSYNSINKVGTYHYTMREELPEGATEENNYTVDGIIYDPGVYTYTVEVTDGGNGQLETVVTGAYDDGRQAKDVRKPEFINDYAAKPVEGSFGGTKILHGQKMLARGQFEFALSIKDPVTKNAEAEKNIILPANLTVKNGLPETVVKNGKEAQLAVDEFWFDNITFKTVGTYKFNVKEVIPDDETRNKNMVYSEDEYVATIVIDDDANGQLYVKDTSFGKVTEGNKISSVGSISFINTEFKPGQIPLYAFKDLTGRELKEGQFQFKLEGEGVAQTASNKKNGVVSFANLQYEFKDLNGQPSRIFTYTIREIIPDDAISDETGKKYKDDPNSKTYKLDGYTYDGHVEDVHVTISSSLDEEGNGVLNVTSDNATSGKMATFRNKYEAEGDIVIDGIKKLHGRKFTKEDSGKFVAELYYIDGPEGFEYKIGDRVIDKGDLVERVDIVKDTRDFGEYGASFEFSKLHYTAEGVYTYKVKESETDTVHNVTNSTEVYTVKVTVTDVNGDGKYTVAKDKTRKDICFINTWNAGNQTEIVARKRVNGEYFSDKLFKFSLEDYDTGKVIKTVTNGDGGYITFEKLDELTYSQDDLDEDGHGEKVYKIYEEVKHVEGYTLSDAVYIVKVYLDLNENGDIDVSKFYFDKYGNPVDEADVVFDNIYDTTGGVELFAYKKVVGADVEAGKFTFQLLDENGNIVREAQNDAAKAGEKTKASFPAILYTKDDLDASASHDIGDGKYVKIYTMREFIPKDAVTTDNGKTYKLDGFTYDTTEYDVIVTLEDNGKGKIETEWFAFKSGTVHKEPNLWQKFWNGVVEFVTGFGKEQNAAFENIYEAEGAIELSAKKVLKGKTLNADEFSFILSGTNENGDKFKQTKSNDADGNVVFDRITFTHEGEYDYTIEEYIPGEPVDGIFILNGVKYDTTKYNIKVTVTDQKNGKLQVTADIAGQPQVTSVEVTDTDGKVISLCTPEAVTFTNEYECKPVKVGLGGDKFLAGRPIVDKEFSFTLDKGDGNNKTDGVPQTVYNYGERFSFDEIEFTFDDMSNGDGTYADSRDFAYTINEVIPSNDAKKPGVTYNVANAVFDVVITVTNNAGQLDAVVKSRNLNAEASYALVDPKEAAQFLNTYEADGEIVFTVEKAVQGTDDDDTVFTFELKGDGLDVPMHTTAVNGQTASFGTIKYSLADLGAPLADGTYKKTFNYEVTEVVPDDKGGYEYSDDVYKAEVVVTSEGTDGKLTVSDSITKNGDYYEPKKPMKFINKYNAKGFVEIPGTKYLEGRKLTDQEFEFMLMSGDGKGNYSKAATTFNDVDGNFKFRIEYDQNSIGKTYYYLVKEIFPSDAKQQGMVCDDSIYEVEVNITDNKNGTLTTTKKFKKNGVEVPERVITSCDFINKIVKTDSVQFSAHKFLEGDNINNYTFKFELLEGNSSKQTVTNKGEFVQFDSIQYKLEDAGKTFHYTIKEVVEDEDGVIKFDRTLYTADVTVKLNDTKLDISTVYKKGDLIINADDIKFINKYRSKTSVKFGGEKVLKGFVDDKITPLGKYTFELYNATGNMIDSVEVEPKTPTDPTKYEFKEIEYNQDDYNNSASTGHRFTYTVSEHVPEQKAANVTYSDKIYHVYVELYKDADKKLQARYWTDENVDPTDGLVFENRYAAKNEIIIDGIKTISGNNLEDGKYTFVLEGKDKDSAVKYEVTNKGALFSFPAIKYEQADIGEHVYEVTESAKTGDGSEYDPSVFTVKVNVSQGSDGVLEVTSTTTKKDADGREYQLGPKEDISFNNVFKANGQIGLEGRKILENKPLKANDFWFVLKDENGNELQKVTCGSSPLKSKDDLTAESTFKFEDLKFTQADLKAGGNSYLKEITKYYTVEELRGNKGGYIYSGEVYAIEVTIKNNGSDKLDVSKKIVAKNTTAASETEGKSAVDLLKFLFADKSGDTEIVFRNSYDSECIIDPPILRKQIMGKNIERGEFEFKVEGPGLKSMGEEKTGYVRNLKNGINTTDGSIYYPDGSIIDEGEIYVGDIKYKYIDLDIDLETGEASRTFEYIATEVPGTDNAIDYSPQQFKLTVTAIDDGEGHMYTVPEIKDMKWVPVTPYVLSDEQMSDTFLNIFNQEGSIDIVGTKKLSGRQLNKDDKFEFTITDDETGASVTRTNTEDANGVPRMIEFRAKDKDGNVDIAFLNYRYGAYETNPDRKDGEAVEFIQYDDTGIHTYTIVEKNIDKAGIKCDTATFKVYVDVQPSRKADGSYERDAKGHAKLNARITDVEKIYSDNNKVKFDFAGSSQFEFVNEFKATGKVEFEGSKYVTDQFGKDAGLAGSLQDKYSFAIYQYDNEARTQGKKLVDVKTTDAAGKFKLSIPEYDQEVLKNEKGEYEESKTLYYRIIETKPANGSWTENNTVFESDGVVYDNTEYDVDVTVAFNGTPELKVTKSVKKAATGEAISGIVFTNVESVEFTDIKGTKTWIDNVKDASTRPDVVVSLFSSAVDGGKKVINTYTIKAPALTYEFSKDAAGEPLPKYDASGKTITYTVSEAPITGYLSEQKGYDFFNTKGTIKIQKVDADTSEPLAGATLAIFDGKTQVEKWTSGNSAHVVEKELTAGKTYTLRELSAPDGYELADDLSFTVPADGSDITVTMKDKPVIGSVRLHKLDSATRKALSGAEFSLYSNEGTRIYATGTAGKYKATSKTSNGVFIVNSAGTLDITELPKGTYYFVETKAPEGYELSSEKLSFTISDSKALVEVTYLNKQSVAAVKLRKVGSTGTRGLEGAVFELYAKTPRTSSQAVSSTIYPDGYYRYGTYTTNSSGEIRVENLPWDDYYFVETKAPEGYTIATDVGGETLAYTFTVDSSTSGSTIDLGDIVNNPEEIDTGVLGERVEPEKPSGVLGVRSAPKKGVLGTRVGPATGDASAIALWLTLLVACIGTIIWMLASKKKKALGK